MEVRFASGRRSYAPVSSSTLSRIPPSPSTTRARNLLVALTLLLSACGGSDSISAPTSPSLTITSLSITGSPVASVNSTGYQFIALAQYSNLTSADVTTSATWTTSNSSIASFTTVAGRPVLSTFQRGVVTITASYSGKSSSLNVTVS